MQAYSVHAHKFVCSGKILCPERSGMLSQFHRYFDLSDPPLFPAPAECYFGINNQLPSISPQPRQYTETIRGSSKLKPQSSTYSLTCPLGTSSWTSSGGHRQGHHHIDIIMKAGVPRHPLF